MRTELLQPGVTRRDFLWKLGCRSCCTRHDLQEACCCQARRDENFSRIPISCKKPGQASSVKDFYANLLPVCAVIRPVPGLRAPLERQRKLQVVFFKEHLVREDLRRRAVRNHYAAADYDAALTDIEDQIEVVGGDDLGMLEGLEQRNH